MQLRNLWFWRYKIQSSLTHSNIFFNSCPRLPLKAGAEGHGDQLGLYKTNWCFQFQNTDRMEASKFVKGWDGWVWYPTLPNLCCFFRILGSYMLSPRTIKHAVLGNWPSRGIQKLAESVRRSGRKIETSKLSYCSSIFVRCHAMQLQDTVFTIHHASTCFIEIWSLGVKEREVSLFKRPPLVLILRKKLPFLPESWKLQMGPSNSYL